MRRQKNTNLIIFLLFIEKKLCITHSNFDEMHTFFNDRVDIDNTTTSVRHWDSKIVNGDVFRMNRVRESSALPLPLLQLELFHFIAIGSNNIPKIICMT